MIDLSLSSTPTLLEHAKVILDAPECYAAEWICELAGEMRKRGYVHVEQQLIVTAADIFAGEYFRMLRNG